MSSDQIEQWLKFGDVVLNNNTAATNCYKMVFSLFLIVDNYLSSLTFQAILYVIFTNANLALIAAIWNEFSTTYALYCMFYIAQNLHLNLKNILRDRYDEFIKFFLKQAEKLLVYILEDDKKTEYALFHISIPKTVLTIMANTILPNIDFDNPNLFGKNQNFNNIMAKSMLNLVDKDKIVEISSTEELYLVVQKFEIEKSIMIGWNGSVPYLNVLVKDMHDTNNKVINERKLYGEAWGKARAALILSSDSNIDSSDSSCKDEVKINNRGWIQICGGAGHN
ncbi:20382_t:CDS:2 [Cetraspora pellucida]|uniref:20382_t:CDS:1 n=1 Tax=Cetraspora pellucida TaxID=1433469 RepID=A0A9N9DRD9_9GLOM|nr:20382_t:CDS:2 [Cetraspora pellucida]